MSSVSSLSAKSCVSVDEAGDGTLVACFSVSFTDDSDGEGAGWPSSDDVIHIAK